MMMMIIAVILQLLVPMYLILLLSQHPFTSPQLAPLFRYCFQCSNICAYPLCFLSIQAAGGQWRQMYEINANCCKRQLRPLLRM